MIWFVLISLFVESLLVLLLTIITSMVIAVLLPSRFVRKSRWIFATIFCAIFLLDLNFDRTESIMQLCGRYPEVDTLTKIYIKDDHISFFEYCKIWDEFIKQKDKDKYKDFVKSLDQASHNPKVDDNRCVEGMTYNEIATDGE